MHVPGTLALALWGRVGGRRTGLDAGGQVAARERHRDGVVVPAVGSAARAGWPPVTTGGVWSTLIFSCTVTVAESSSALQNSLVPGVSA